MTLFTDSKDLNPFEDQPEESLEEILSSIRKIMEPSLTPMAETPSKKVTRPPLVAPKEDVLVLRKKADISVKETLSEAKPAPKVSSAGSGKSPLETMILTSMNPLIKSWIEKNLSQIVEKIVREEIQRLLNPSHKSR
ncbi:MAG: DUF2497 domain-containing protein [Alphaproteobacteria bacterium]